MEKFLLEHKGMVPFYQETWVTKDEVDKMWGLSLYHK